MRIAIDAMGGDYAPKQVIQGAILALQEVDSELILVGKSERIRSFLPHNYKNIEVRHASQVVNMKDSSTASIRSKKDCSVNVAINMVKSSEADAIITAGHTGAAVCSATINLGLLEKIGRPGIATVLPTLEGYSLLIDAGANISAKPEHLLQYAIMGVIYSKYIMNKDDVKVGLLNIGEEETKGTDFLQQTHKLLNSSNLDFIGNLEGADVFKGVCDVVVCDGFAGNITLKVAEGFADAIIKLMKRNLNASLISKIGGFLSKGAFGKLYKEIDCAEYGGAPLLGLKKVCIISHGSSTARAIKNAVIVAGESVRCNINKHILKSLKQSEGLENE